jgi:hypothetical protein
MSNPCGLHSRDEPNTRGLHERDNRQWESNLTIQVGLVAAPPRKLIDSDEE